MRFLFMTPSAHVSCFNEGTAERSPPCAGVWAEASQHLWDLGQVLSPVLQCFLQSGHDDSGCLLEIR